MITQILSGNFISKIKSLQEKTKEFHNKYVHHWSFPMAPQEFQNFRCSYLNRVREEFQEIFCDDRTIQLLINLLQFCFTLQKEMYGNLSEKIYDFFFFASCFIITKLEHPELFKRLKVKVCDLEIDIKIIFNLEQLIMNKIEWKLNLSTCAELQTLIINEIIQNDFETERKSLNEATSDWVNFSLFEYSLYSKYDQVLLTFACISIILEARKLIILIERLNFISESLVDRNYLQECIENIRITLEEETDNDNAEVVVQQEIIVDDNIMLNNTKENTNHSNCSIIENSLHDQISPLLEITNQESISTNFSSNHESVSEQFSVNHNNVFLGRKKDSTKKSLRINNSKFTLTKKRLKINKSKNALTKKTKMKTVNYKHKKTQLMKSQNTSKKCKPDIYN